MNAKRPAEETIPIQRRTRIKLASPSPERTSASDTESIHSCQGYKTELANDTSDTSSPSIPQPYNIEFEVTDPQVQKLKFYFSEDSSEENDLQSNLLDAASNDSLDKAVLGGTSEENSTSPTSNSDVDPGLPRNDYLDFEHCLLCKTDKKNISYPYCSNCFTWKKNLFPSRPKRNRKSNTKSETESALLHKNSVHSNKSINKCIEDKSRQENLSDGLFEDSGVGSTEPQFSEDTVDGPSQPSTSSISTSTSTSNSSNVNNYEACRVCFLKPENGLFVHLNIAHRYGCYSCAKEIWYHNGGCPLCRRKVFKVTKMYH